MISETCLHLEMNGKDELNNHVNRCRMTTNRHCPTNCPFATYNVEAYMLRLYDLRFRNKGNIKMLKEVNAEIDMLFHQFQILPHDPHHTDMSDWERVYHEEVHRGEKGGKANEGGSQRNLKQRMKDNRAPETKMSRNERHQLNEAIEDFEAVHGKLEKLGRSGVSKSRTDSYTGEVLFGGKEVGGIKCYHRHNTTCMLTNGKCKGMGCSQVVEE